MKINSTTAYIVNKSTIKQFVEELIKSGYTVKDDIRLVTKHFGDLIDAGYYVPIFPRHPYVQYTARHSKLSLAEMNLDVIKRETKVDDVVIYKPKIIL